MNVYRDIYPFLYFPCQVIHYLRESNSYCIYYDRFICTRFLNTEGVFSAST